MAARGATVVAKPGSDAYVGLLAVSLVAMIVGCALLGLDLSQYPDKVPSVPQVSVPQKGQAPAGAGAPVGGGAVPGAPGAGQPMPPM
jgi:hypothetical protein